MEIAVEHSVEEVLPSRKKPTSWYKSWKLITTSIVMMIALTCAALYFYQINHFNQNITINGINMGGLTTEEALKKLQTSVLENTVYVGDQEIVDGLNTEMRFKEDDLQNLEKVLENQWTFFPSSVEKNYPLAPVQDDQFRSIILKYDLEQKLIALNQNLTAPVDSHAILENGKITITKSVEGTKYDVASLLEEFEIQEYTSEIHLEPIYKQPIREDSQAVKNEEEKLQALLQHTVEYQVQDQVHPLKGSDLIKDATLTKDMTFSVDPVHILNKLTEINNTQSTLGKEFTFTTHNGSAVQVKGEGYGWALDVEKETALVKEAFEKGEASVAASNIYGNGWSGEGYGYETTANGGIGGTYAEVSIKEQRLWLYKDGKQVFTTHVVTGNQSTGQDTSTGVWYVLFKRTPYTLTGTSPDNPYSIKVNYWAPFTNSGQGFHDASWRGNWRGNAYYNAGSNGCVNIPPNAMSTVYSHLDVYQPVVIY